MGEPYLRLFGDIHEGWRSYADSLDVPYSIQVGDLCMTNDYSWMIREGIDPARHRFIGGNHDNYDHAPNSPHYLGDYGVHAIPEFGDVFFVRGAWSIDRKSRRTFPTYSQGRVLPKTLWDEEELTMRQGMEALELYKEVKPKFLVAHECPLSVVPYVTNPEFCFRMGWDAPDGIIRTKTNQLLQAMIEFHKPHTMVFGHYHKDFDQVIDGIRFICVNICKYVDFPKDYLHENNPV